MIKSINYLIVAGFVILCGLLSWAAPIRPVGPVDVVGTINEVKWVPERSVKGIPRMSGSAGRDRVVSPYLLVKLVDYEGISAETAITITRYLEWSAYQNLELKGRPPFILLKIDYGDRNYLKKGMRIKVSGYKIAGDEGGTWSSFTGIEIL